MIKEILKLSKNLFRPLQARHLDELLNLAGIRKTTECYKPLRLSEIKKSEQNVLKVTQVLENEYLNPFSILLDPDLLFNLSSGCSKEENTDDLLNIWNKGKSIAEKFSAQRIFSDEKPMHDPISRNKIPTFQSPKIKVSSCKGTKVIDANRNIIEKLLDISAKFQKPIDFANALKFPLFAVPLNLAYPDGSRRETSKSKLLDVIAPDIKEFEGVDIVREQTVFIIDMIAQIRVCTTNCPDTYEEFITKLLQSFPKGYQRVDIIADTYRATSIKNQERNRRGQGTKIIIGSSHSKMPRDINKFIMNGENKTALIDLTFQYIMENKEIVIQLLQTQMVVLSGDDKCFTITCDNNVSAQMI